MFWLSAVAMAAVAAVLAAWPLARGAKSGSREEREDTNRSLYRDRLAELDEEISWGQTDAAARAEIENELGAALLADFETGRSDQPDGEESRSLSWLAAAIGVPVLSLVVYFSLGDPDADRLKAADQIFGLDAATGRADLEDWRSLLRDRVDGRPEDGKSWYLLGQTYLKLAEFPQAAGAFSMAHVYLGDDPTVDLYWLQSRYLANGALDEVSRGIAERILESFPDHPLVMELYAVEALRAQDYREAVTFLNRGMNNPLSERQMAAMRTTMQQARDLLGDLAPSIDVSISAEGQPPRDATLFVIARPVGGGMPFAVIKRPTFSLPLSVRLDDAVSMNPAVGLSAAGSIEVVVRLSLSGAPMSHPGDWEWQSEPVELTGLSEPLELEAVLSEPPARPAPPL